MSDTRNKWAGDPSPHRDVSFHAANDKLKVRRRLAAAIKPATVGKHQDFTAIPLKAISAWDAKERLTFAPPPSVPQAWLEERGSKKKKKEGERRGRGRAHQLMNAMKKKMPGDNLYFC